MSVKITLSDELASRFASHAVWYAATGVLPSVDLSAAIEQSLWDQIQFQESTDRVSPRLHRLHARADHQWPEVTFCGACGTALAGGEATDAYRHEGDEEPMAYFCSSSCWDRWCRPGGSRHALIAYLHPDCHVRLEAARVD